MKEKKKISRALFIASGKKGGTTTAKRGKSFYKTIGKLGAQKRWKK